MDRWITIQENALLSYVRLHPNIQILVFGADERCEEFCSHHGIRCLPTPESNKYGTPLVSALFGEALKLAAYEQVMYINADTILLKDFASMLKRVAFDRFVLVGRTWGVEINESLDVGLPADEQRLRSLVKKHGYRRSGSDYFVFTRTSLASIPDFAIGRPAWDNWLLFDTFRRGIPLIDASEAAIVVHQNHGWSNHPGGQDWVWKGPEAKRNLELAAEMGSSFTNRQCTWKLGQSGGPRRVLSRGIILRKMQLRAKDSPMMGYLSRIMTALFYPHIALKKQQSIKRSGSSD